jgi:hypothetical protein
MLTDSQAGTAVAAVASTTSSRAVGVEQAASVSDRSVRGDPLRCWTTVT